MGGFSACLNMKIWIWIDKYVALDGWFFCLFEYEDMDMTIELLLYILQRSLEIYYMRMGAHR